MGPPLGLRAGRGCAGRGCYLGAFCGEEDPDECDDLSDAAMTPSSILITQAFCGPV